MGLIASGRDGIPSLVHHRQEMEKLNGACLESPRHVQSRAAFQGGQSLRYDNYITFESNVLDRSEMLNLIRFQSQR